MEKCTLSPDSDLAARDGKKKKKKRKERRRRGEGGKKRGATRGLPRRSPILVLLSPKHA